MNELREAVIKEARSWIGTPFHHASRIKGVGVDCAQFLIAVYSSVNVVADFLPKDYPRDWHLHSSDERFLNYASNKARLVKDPQPGDFMVMRFGRCYSHGAIVLNAREVIHAFVNRGVEVADVREWKNRHRAFFSPFPQGV